MALWSLLAVLTVGAAPVPPLLLNAICFGIGGGIGLVWIALGGRGFGFVRRIRPASWLLGVGGLFGYHFLYFSALRMAPPAEAGLIAYLWPLLIVLLSGLLPGEVLRRGHVAGATLAFAGAALLVLEGGRGFLAASLPGYGLALLCALTWAGYSVLSRLSSKVPSEAVALFCLATALLSAVAHLALEQTLWPDGAVGWLSCLALGAGPVGLAFYLWDIGVKRGNIQMLGVASYAAPLISTLILVATGITAPRWTLLAAAMLIAGGAALAARAGRR